MPLWFYCPQTQCHSPSSVWVIKLTHCSYLQLQTLPTVLNSSAHHWLPSQVRIHGHPMWIPLIFCLISGNLHLFTSGFSCTCEYRPLSSSAGLWSIIMASWLHTLRNKCSTPILKNSSINLLLPFRGCLSPSLVGWHEKAQLMWLYVSESRICMTVKLVSLSGSKIAGAKGQIVIQAGDLCANLNRKLVDTHCLQILPSHSLFNDL